MDETVADVERRIRKTGGKPVVYAGESSYGHFEAPGEVVLAEDGRAGVISTDPSVVIATGVFTAPLSTEELITVDETAYQIRQSLPFEDGALTRIWLMEP